jgi:ParB-like chromosome segregation protein Spo0J
MRYDFTYIAQLPIDEQVSEINKIRKSLHEVSPFKDQPIDCVQWVSFDSIKANEYNPNKVAPPEMQLLEQSILEDGYTQPIVSWVTEDKHEVIDGFHRSRVGKESEEVRKRIQGYLPLVVVNDSQTDKGDRIASTIRHNRARGKHQVESMSDIVVELKKRNWSDDRIAKNLGMDKDEILRLCQVSGLAEVFENQEFSKAWEAEIYNEEDFSFLTESDLDEQKEKETERILHTYDKWECFKAGFYREQPPVGMTIEQAEEAYRDFLSNLKLFEKALKKVIVDWKHSCEHYLTNDSMNRIAWLGQASVSLELGIPSRFRGGYNLLTDEQKKKADKLAFKYLNKWLKQVGRKQLDTIEEAGIKSEVNLY